MRLSSSGHTDIGSLLINGMAVATGKPDGRQARARRPLRGAQSASGEEEPAIDREIDTRHEAAFVRGEEQGGRRQFLGLPEAPERNAR